MRLFLQHSIAGVFARRLLLPVLCLPFLFGVLTALGAQAGWYSPGTASALLILSVILALAPLVWQNALTLKRVEDLRQQREVERTTRLAVEHRARLDAEEALRMRDTLLALISHDLKNPLTVIKGHAERLQRAAERQLDAERVRGSARQIDTAAVQMLDQINELIDLARVQAGQDLLLTRVPVDLIMLTREVVELYAQAQDHHELHIEAMVPALPGSWDTARLRRVISNLVSNALKYSPAGGQVVLRLERDEARGRWAQLAIRDQGIGIPAADLPHIFQPFHRATNVTPQIPGTGLGLASARWIVEQHGGSLRVTSEVGVGTTFTLRLPMDEGDQAPGHQRDNASVGTGDRSVTGC